MRMIAAAVLAAGGLGLAARADDKPLDRALVDKRAAKAAYDTALLGSELWKAGNYEGCFRLYQGSLMGLRPMLDHRPKLMGSVLEALNRADRMRPEEGAFVLRAALDAIRKETAAPPPKPLWDRLGGEKTARAVVKDFVDAALKDPKADLSRGGKYKWEGKDRERLEQVMVEILSDYTNGPLKYTGPGPDEVMAGTKITDDEFRVMGQHLVVALKAHKVSDEDATAVLERLGRLKPYVVGK
ncbi:MAG: group 1 truncated hemoglobin [Gemmataceae bacterium]|nr:group 1 truncated hemoglobin [Gemmataceae bacterium]